MGIGSFFRSWHGRARAKAPPSPSLPPPHGDTPDDWQAGDLAECIHGGFWFNGAECHARGPENGQVLRVERVSIAPNKSVIPGQTVLVFARFQQKAYAACAFRKITPHADRAEAADAAFIAAIDRLRAPVAL